MVQLLFCLTYRDVQILPPMPYSSNFSFSLFHSHLFLSRDLGAYPSLGRWNTCWVLGKQCTYRPRPMLRHFCHSVRHIHVQLNIIFSQTMYERLHHRPPQVLTDQRFTTAIHLFSESSHKYVSVGRSDRISHRPPRTRAATN